MLLMAERRRKTRGSDNGGHGAAGKNPRRSKARPARQSKEHPDPEPNGSGEERDSRQPAPAQDASPESPRTALPGAFFQRADRWWWRVKLPGEDKAKARPLKLHGAKTATGNRESAEKIAFEMWEHAVQEYAVRQVLLESTEKMERLKAQFLDKVRYFTELVETANAKIEAETKARAEAEAKLAQMAQSGQPSMPNSGPKQEEKELPAPRSETQVGAREIAPPPDSNPPLEVGVCECCGDPSVALADLRRIDSGQLLCPRCLAALRAEAVRTEATPTE